MSRTRINRFVPLIILTLFGILLSLALTLTGSVSANSLVAQPKAMAAAPPDTITACTGQTTTSSKLTLGGRVITPSTLLRFDPSGICASDEVSVTWNVQGPKGDQGIQGEPGIQGPQGVQGPKGDPTYVRTIVVGPVSSNDPISNGTALLGAMTTISNANPSATKPYLLKVEPGNYIISNSLTMLPYVDLEGSGEDTTVISSTNSKTLISASNTEVRYLSIISSGTISPQIAVSVPNGTANARLTHMSALAESYAYNWAYGLYNSGSVSLTNATLTASGGGGTNTGAYNFSNLSAEGSNFNVFDSDRGFAALNVGTFTAIGSTFTSNNSLEFSFGMRNNGSGIAIVSSSFFTVTGTGNTYLEGVGFFSTNLTTINNSTFNILGGTNSTGLGGDGSLALNNSTVVAGGASSLNYGINANGKVLVNNSNLTTYGGTNSAGIWNYTSGVVAVSNSILSSSGSNNSYGVNVYGGSVKVTNSQLSGDTAASSGLSVCPYSVNATTFAPLNGSCQ